MAGLRSGAARSAYAADAHRDDLRKGTDIPYLSHLWSVAALVLEHGGDDTQVAAGLLHDVVEDHGGIEQLAEVRERFGDEVARLVEGLSDSVVDTTAGGEKPPWKARKTAYLADLAAADARAIQLVSACDKLHNARCILADLRVHGADLWERFTVTDPAEQLWYYDPPRPHPRRRPTSPRRSPTSSTRTVEALIELTVADDATVADRLRGGRCALTRTHRTTPGPACRRHRHDRRHRVHPAALRRGDDRRRARLRPAVPHLRRGRPAASTDVGVPWDPVTSAAPSGAATAASPWARSTG